jgi:hypothetical protein
LIASRAVRPSFPDAATIDRQHRSRGEGDFAEAPSAEMPLVIHDLVNSQAADGGPTTS